MASCLNVAQKQLISLTSWDTCDPIFRSHDGTLESVGKGSGYFGKARGKKEGRGGWGKKSGRDGWGRTKNQGEVGWVDDDVIEKNRKLKN